MLALRVQSRSGAVPLFAKIYRKGDFIMQAVYDFFMYLTGWPLALVLFVGGLYFTIRTGCLQVKMF